MGDTTSMSDERILAQEEQGLIDPRPEGEVETERTRRNIRNTLKYQLHKEYGIPVKDTGDLADRILKVHGLSKDDFDVVHKMHSLMTNKLNDESIDPNANKDSRTVLGIQMEASNSNAKAIGYDFLYCQMLKDWGKKEAKELSGLMYDYSIPIHDSTKLLTNYCWAFDASKIVFEGRPFGQVKSKPPKRVSSYIASLDETIHQMTNHLAGAIAVGTLFSDIAYILINREHITLEQIKNDAHTRKYIENCLQTFIYSVNHLSRASNESPFTNVSIFDRPKLKALFGEDNMGWMFHTEEGEIDPEYFYDVIEELQDIYMDLFDAGDPLSDGLQFRFPVSTCLPGDENFFLNDKLVSFEEAFGTYEKGWTDVSDRNLYTEGPDGNKVKITKVYVGESDTLITLKGYGAGKSVRFTPEHNQVLSDGTKKATSDVQLKDTLAYSMDSNLLRGDTTIDMLDILPEDDTVILGYKISAYKDDNTSPNVQQNRNNIKSHPVSVIKQYRDKAYEVPEVEYVKFTASKKKTSLKRFINADFDTGFLIGFYGANGNACGDIHLAVNNEDTDTLDKLVSAISSIGKEGSIRARSKVGAYDISYSSNTFVAFFKYFVPGYAKTKRLNISEILKYNKEFVRGIILGYLAGDGNINKWSINACSASRGLLEDIQFLSRAIGIGSSLSDETSNSRGYGVESSMINSITFRKYSIIDTLLEHKGYCSRKFGSIDYPDSKTMNHIREYIVNKKTMESFEEPVKVYCIEVDNDSHTFTLPCGLVTSNCNISKTETGELNPDSVPFLKKICKRPIYRYNIFTSLGTKVASCCFDYDTEIHFYDKNDNVYRMSIGDFVESRLKDTELGGRDYIQTTFKPEEAEDFIAVPGGMLAPITGVIKLANKHRKLISITFTSGDNIKVTPEQQMMCQNGEMIRARDLIEGSYLYNDLVVASVEEIKSDAPVYDIEVGTEEHLFKIKMEKSGHNLRVANCRLINDAELNELGAQVNSFGGSAVSMGSHRVALLNTNRYALELQGKGDADDFLRLLDKRLEQATKILISHRHLVQMTQKLGLQLFMDLGWIQMEKMFSTIGLIGITETVETLNAGIDTSAGDKKLTIGDMMVFINTKVKELSSKYHIPMNIEQVPGESMAPRLAKVDKMLFGEDKVPYVLYSNQFIPLWEDVTIFERMEADGKYNQLFTGGGIVHFNLGEDTTPQQNEELIRYMIKCGCEHASLNRCYARCENGHTTLTTDDKCPKCGAKITQHLTRVVGFLTVVENWVPERRDWEFPRRKFKGLPTVEEMKTEEEKFD